MTQGQKYGIGIFLFISVFAVILFFTKRVGEAPSSDEIIISKNSVTVESQPAGMSVVVKKAFLDERLWMVIYEEQNGERENILGAQRLPNGEHMNSSIPLLRGTEIGQQYHLVLHQDDGDDSFNFTKDLPLENISYTFFAR